MSIILTHIPESLSRHGVTEQQYIESMHIKRGDNIDTLTMKSVEKSVTL